MRFFKIILHSFVALLFFNTACTKSDSTKIEGELTTQILDPFADNNGFFPSPEVFDGPFFKANYNYPEVVPERTYPWEEVLGGMPLTKNNAVEYIMAVRQYIAEDMALMIDQPAVWTDSPNRQNWYNMAWSAQNYHDSTGWEGLESVYGTMTGQVIKNDIFTDYGFEGPMQNHALVYYNDISALTLNQLWKSKSPTGFFPDYSTNAAQFKQNAIVIKAAGTTASAAEWPVLKGAGTFSIYREEQFGPNYGKGRFMQELTWIQFDIIIKDTIASPETGWVFSTFIYDVNSPGTSTFDKLTLLGVSWGNDPGEMNGDETLEETYLNPNAPAYASVTLGYGKRLSGPIDVGLVGGAQVDPSAIDSVLVLGPNNEVLGSNKYLHFAASACFSCHSTASWPEQNDFYPSPDPRQKLVFSDTLFNPSSVEWSNYFQNRPGTEIMINSEGLKKSIMALDYDLFMQFALNNSRLGQRNLPKGIQIPAGYTLLDPEKHQPQLKLRSK
jgi:hypothetical protein